MAVDVELSQSTGYAKATVKGNVGLAESREVLRQVVTAMEQTEVSSHPAGCLRNRMQTILSRHHGARDGPG